MEDEDVDRDLQRKRRDDTPKRISIDYVGIRDIVELGKYRDLIDMPLPTFEIIKKRKLVIK